MKLYRVGGCVRDRLLGIPVNDIDWVVTGATTERMLAAGYREGFVPEPHPYRKRVYFVDDDGLEYEFVQYYSDDSAERNDYAL